MASADPGPELKTYHGSCHCGAFKYHINIPDITENEVSFCPTCGIAVLFINHTVPSGSGIVARTLHDVDIWPLKQRKFDGAAIPPPFVPHKFTGELPAHDFGENTKLYTGGCHCGAITVALKTDGPLPTSKERNGSTRCYPLRSQYSVSDPTSALAGYSFGPEFSEHRFYVFDSWPPEKKFRWDNQMPVNLRVLEGVEWDVLEKGLEEGKPPGEGGIGHWPGRLVGRGGNNVWE
ncbi:hypothetical protein B7463_g12540, partial [Scytalidium lignicola]